MEERVAKAADISVNTTKNIMSKEKMLQMMKLHRSAQYKKSPKQIWIFSVVPIVP